ncbi:MAG TPA: hypothetical protein VGS41_07020 [Chthonomonadales bacterium]|nr:hypothetical protein [Chthonomonadales bacterium]
MKIRLTKDAQGHATTLTCIREDGTSTWQRSSDYMARHDLCHCAAESALGYTQGFLGLVANGRDLWEFGTRNGERDEYTEQERWAEEIAGALLWPDAEGMEALTDEGLYNLLLESLQKRGLEPPPVTLADFSAVRSRASELLQRWQATPAGSKCEVDFPA